LIVSFSFAYLLRFNFEITAIPIERYQDGIGIYLLGLLISFFITKSYSGIVRYTGLEDGIRVFKTTSIGTSIVFLFDIIIESFIGYRIIPLSILLISYFIAGTLLFVYRLSVKSIFNYYARAVKKRTTVAIFGAGDSGILTKQLLDSEKASGYKVIAFFEDDESKLSKVVQGVQIYNPETHFKYVLRKKHFDELIISVKDLSLRRKNELVELCLKNDVKVRTIPPVEKWFKGELSINQIKEVDIEELLGREVITLNNIEVSHEVNRKKILVTGAAGSIGSELVRQLSDYGPDCIILFDQWETGLFEIESEILLRKPHVKIFPLIGDITDESRVREIFETYKPDIVYHAAAYKHVPVMEKNASEAVRCNILGTKIVADAAYENHVQKFVMISTDKAVNPTSVMGASKRIAEMYTQSLNDFKVSNREYYTKFVTTRFGNVLGSSGSVIPIFKRQISEGGPITVTHPEVTRYFMTIPEACQLVLEAGAMGKGGELFIFDMGESIKIVDLAKKMINLSGLEEDSDIEIHFTGLRDGEKLYEELLNKKEDTIPTHHDKILIAKVNPLSFLKVSQEVSQLISMTKEINEIQLVSAMKKMVPEYKSNASKFGELDPGLKGSY